ncbi:hypothetical protein NG2371_04235 [Nocardia gamkensis]|nr:hypothetical protein [Nocardia gamkensis]
MDQRTGGQGRGDPGLGIAGQVRNDRGTGSGGPQRDDLGFPPGGQERGGVDIDSGIPEPEERDFDPVGAGPKRDSRTTGAGEGDADADDRLRFDAGTIDFGQVRDDPRAGRGRDERELDDVSAISRLKYRYLRTLDTKSWDDFADTMVPEATATYSEYLQFESREAFIAFMRNTLGPHVITEHRCDHPEIDVDGDTATGTWYLADTVLIPGHNMLLRGAAFYTDRYVRCDDGHWRISHTGYERTYEVVLSLSDLPSLRLTSSRWGLIAKEDGISSIERDPGAPPMRPESEAG